MGPELYDQEGYLIRIGVGGCIKIDGKPIRGKDVDVFVNDDRWSGVQYIDAQADELEDLEIGGPGPQVLVPNGVHGHIEILVPLESDGEPVVEPARRIMNLLADSVLAVVVNDPDTGVELRRITCYGCRWEPPSAHSVARRDRMLIGAAFKAERYEDA